MMKKLFKSKSSMFVTALLGAAVIAFGASASAFTYTWFSKTNVIDNEHIGGNTTGAYYRSGTGTSDDPYIIDSPIHLRNLAWLQYLGEYNKIVDGQYNQTYFKVVKDLDMSNYVLPPIGTTANPFIGNFDGDGHTIANLRTTNDYSSMTRVPDVVKSVSDVNVIGFFGVIGDPGDVIVDSAYDLSINELKNFNLQGNTVTDTLPTTLIGITAGFVNAPISAVTMAGCTLTVPNGGASAYDSSLTTNLSNYTSLGYCTDKYRSTNRDTKVEISNADPVYTVTSTEGEGEAGGWGGSIDMKSMFNRITAIKRQSTSKNFHTIQTSINTYPDKQDEKQSQDGPNRSFGQFDGGKKGKASFSSMSTTQYLYLYGREDFDETITTTPHTIKETTVSGYVITSGSNYMTLDGTTIGNTTNINNAQLWTLSSTTGNTTIKAVDSNYYLGYTTSGKNQKRTSNLAVKTTSTRWSRNGTQLYVSAPSGQQDNVNHYLRYTRNGWAIATDLQSGISFTQHSITNKEYVPGKSTSTTVPYMSTNDTYLPLNVDENYEAKKGNTGYLTSGADFKNTDYPNRSGDARVSQYSMTDIANSLGGSGGWGGVTFANERFEIVTRTSNSGGFVRISYDYNKNNGTIATALSNAVRTKTDYKTLGLEKYEKSRQSVGEVLSSSNNIYGMHFMDATISATKKFKTDYAMIIGQEYDSGNYELPENCIDFNLADRGAVNFFGGTYFSGNDSFFSFHEITREMETITGIKEIVAVYGDSNPKHTYVYKYADGTYNKAYEIVKGEKIPMTYSGNYPGTYSQVFDMEWIKHPTAWVNKAVYYFEIPVNDGEYALGSVPGSDGAYLLYLDIGGNAQEVNRTAISTTRRTIDSLYDYPLGISFVDPSDKEKEDTDSAAMALSSSFKGSIQVNRSSDTISYQSSSYDAISATYKGDDITLMAGSTEITEVNPISSTDETDKILTYVDYNVSTDETTKTIFTEYADGSREVVVIKQDGTESEGEWGETEIDVSGVVKELTYRTFYYGDTEINCTLETTYNEIYDNVTGKLFYEISGYKLTVTTTKETVKLSVTQMKSGYAVYANDTLVGTIPFEMDIEPTPAP